MKAALINGSPKQKDSTSECILNDLKLYFSQGLEMKNFIFNRMEVLEEDIEELLTCDILIFAFPLYVDGVPAHLLSCLCQLEEVMKQKAQKEIFVYALCNCGFYEGEQCQLALHMIRNWSTKAGLHFGQGLGIGCGGAYVSIESVKPGTGPKKEIGAAMEVLAYHAENLQCSKNQYVQMTFPRFVYKMFGEISWIYQVKKNGLKIKDLWRRM